MHRRLKHWGWGYEDEQPSLDELRGAAAFARERLGFGSLEPERPVPLRQVSLPNPRLKPSAALEPICASDTYERALHAYGRSYSDVVRAFRGRFDHPPDVVAYPRDELDLEAVLEWAASMGAAVIPFGGGTRRCLGAALAMAEQKVVLRAIARRTDLAATTPKPEKPRL